MRTLRRVALHSARIPVCLAALGIVLLVARMLYDQAAGTTFRRMYVTDMFFFVTACMIPVVRVGIVLPMMLRQATTACTSGRLMDPWSSGLIAVMFGVFGSLLFFVIAAMPAVEGGTSRETSPIQMMSIPLQAATVVALLHWMRQSIAGFTRVHPTHPGEVDADVA